MPTRRRLPPTRKAIIHKFNLGETRVYLIVGLYEDGTPGEIFVNINKQGSTISGLMDSFAILMSYALQYGLPLKEMVAKFKHVRFEPAGLTKNKDIPMASSVIDYIFTWLEKEFVLKSPGGSDATSPNKQD
jgi:ribonucleoside-diphosphate reductase alpha chain